MMLSRTANDLFWMSRYVERAENIARLLEVADRMSLMPQQAGGTDEWSAVLIAGGIAPIYREHHDRVDAASTIEFMALSADNPSSIRNCFGTARENARAQRHTLTREMWEAINDSWLEIRDMTPAQLNAMGHSAFFDMVKRRSHLVRGAMAGTLIRDDGFRFIRLGTFVERADSTARILDVKYHLILPAGETIGGSTDYYQWAALLQSVSAHGSYNRLTGDTIRPWKVAEMLILRPEMPRSIRSAYDELMDNLRVLTGPSGSALECMRMAGKLHSQLLYARIEEIFQGNDGLHGFLTHVVDTNMAVAHQITRDFLMITDTEETAGTGGTESPRQHQSNG